MYKILISGYYGFDNIGDESILRTVIDNLRRRIPQCSLTVLSHNPASTREKYGVEAVDRMSPLRIYRAVANCDMLISGGGSLLQDVTSARSIHYYLWIISLARHLGKKVFIYSQGIGPINREDNRRSTARAFQGVDGIVVRDERSAQLLEDIGIARERIVITADPVIRMERPDTAPGRRILRRAGVPLDGHLTVGWAIREKDANSPLVQEIIQSIRYLKENYQAESVLIPFHYGEDRAICSTLAEQLGGDAYYLDEKYLSEDMLSIIGNVDVLVGMRLHSLISAAIMGVPMIGISYDPKCTEFLRSVGLTEMSTRETFSKARFQAAFEDVLAHGKEQTAMVDANMAHLRSKLDTNEDMILSILKESSDKQKRKGKSSSASKNINNNNNNNNNNKNNKREKGEGAASKTAGAISLVFILTLVARLLGIVREMCQASYFGTGVDADLYTAAYNSSIYLFTTICYALCIAAVPILTKEFAASRQRGVRAANNLVTVTLAGALVVFGIWQIWVSTPLLSALWDVGFLELPRLALFIRIMSCTLPVIAMAYLMVAVFQATDHYTLQGSMSIPYNVFLSLFLLICGKRFGILGVVIACALAWLLQLAMSLPYARAEHYWYRPLFDVKADYLGVYFRTALVTVLTTSIFLFCYLIDTSTTASLKDESVSAFYYADKLFTPLTTSILYSISAVMFPRFNRAYDEDDVGSYLGYIWQVTENTLLFMLPVCAMMYTFGEDIIQFIFQSGSFDAASTMATGRIFRMYALGMCGFSVLDLLNKANYAMKRTLSPLVVNLFILVLNLLLDRVFQTGEGIALATSLSITIGAVIMTGWLFHGSGRLHASALLRGVLATAAMAFVLLSLHAMILNGSESKILLLIKCGAIGVVGAIVYIVLSLLLRQEIFLSFLDKFKHRKAA